MKRVIQTIRTVVRLAILHGFYSYYVRQRARLPEVSWVIGPNDVASMGAQLKSVIPGSFTFMKAAHPFYAHLYDFCPPKMESGLACAWRIWVAEPRLFARLAATAKGFIYLNELGYLRLYEDAREFEFRFLSERGVKIVCYFTGSDIRSPLISAQVERETGLPNLGTYLADSDPNFRDPKYDESRKMIAKTADTYADAILNFSIDHSSYLESDTLPFIYLIPDAQLHTSMTKYDGDFLPVVFHAPSNPMLKGTQLVRAAVEQLRREGIDFEYIEFTNTPHEEVVAQLVRSHVVLNQFYSHVPGVFGVESLAAGCVVMMSADEDVELDLPRGSNKAWVVTKHWQVTTHLRELLLNRDKLRAQAVAGQAWVRAHALASVSGARLRSMLDAL